MADQSKKQDLKFGLTFLKTDLKHPDSVAL